MSQVRRKPSAYALAQRYLLGTSLLLLAGLFLHPFLVRAGQPQFLQHGFESRDPLLVAGAADAKYQETAHRLTDPAEQNAHEGQRSEFLQLQAEQGSFIYYTLDLGRAPVAEELNTSLFLKANRPNMQLLGRLVLPRERDPKNLDQPLTSLLRGTPYQNAGRWQRLELRNPLRLLKEQQQFLRAELKRDIDITDAYIDRLVINVYGGPGLTEVWIDDLEAGPLLEGPAVATAQPATKEGQPETSVRRAAEVRLQSGQLLVNGRKFFLRGIRHTGTPLKTLRDAGFNTLWIDEETDSETITEAAKLNFWLVPALAVADRSATLTSNRKEAAPGELMSRKLSRFLEQDAVLGWDLGGGLAAEQYQTVARTAQAVRGVDPLRPFAVDVWDGFRSYSRGVDQLLSGVHRWPLYTSLELPQYRQWLTERRMLAQPGTFTWTWVQTHLPDWFTQNVYGADGLPVQKTGQNTPAEPIGPQPEQIRLLAYTALASGCRGLGFWSDRFLADSHTGRDRLLQLALLNQELILLEPLLVTAEAPSWIDTSVAQVKAAVMRTERGVLCLPIWMGPGSQFVPGQAAAANVTMTVPQTPTGSQPWLVSPGEVRALEMERVPGGTKITIPEFGLTAAVVFTSDLSQTGLVVRLQDLSRRMAKLATQWSYDLAQEELAKVEQVEGELEQAGHTLPDAQKLLKNARERLQQCSTHRRNEETREAYLEAQRALRPLRILMRAQWEAATKKLDTPTSSPYAVSFYTLPRHWRFLDQVNQAEPRSNVLPDGNFESPAERALNQWMVQEVTLDNVESAAQRVTEQPKEGKQCLMLKLTPRDRAAPPVALERTFLALHSPAVRLEPGTPVRISGWVRIPGAIQASADGVLLYDSAGGEPLAVRLTAPTKWKQFVLYRKVPASGSISVTLALTGLGSAYFDDVKIEPLQITARGARP